MSSSTIILARLDVCYDGPDLEWNATSCTRRSGAYRAAFLSLSRRTARTFQPYVQPGVSLAEFETSQGFYRLSVRPTALGKHLLAGHCDYVHICGLDRWIGGVHLEGRTAPWRFDRTAGRLVET